MPELRRSLHMTWLSYLFNPACLSLHFPMSTYLKPHSITYKRPYERTSSNNDGYSQTGVLVNDDDYSNIELGDFTNELLIPLPKEKLHKYSRYPSTRMIHFTDEMGGSIETVTYSDHLVYRFEEDAQASCCSIF